MDGFCSEKFNAVIRISSVPLWLCVYILLHLLLDFEIGFPPVLLQKMQFKPLAMAPMWLCGSQHSRYRPPLPPPPRPIGSRTSRWGQQALRTKSPRMFYHLVQICRWELGLAYLLAFTSGWGVGVDSLSVMHKRDGKCCPESWNCVFKHINGDGDTPYKERRIMGLTLPLTGDVALVKAFVSGPVQWEVGVDAPLKFCWCGGRVRLTLWCWFYVLYRERSSILRWKALWGLSASWAFTYQMQYLTVSKC